ncbi:spore coat protein [Thalassobacillus sp. CUG 92003]|uniref:spore coat protein n=1 Tax=Thalassobacillus sp. CUG 92003 TaxID=2736641 RepID=UPI0015E7CF04|nr:spore coat protein [Thalassobacillus sp. CUG 92003]
MGRRYRSQNDNQQNCSQEETIVHPTERVVKTRTNHRTVRNIHPTEVENVNRTIVRNENYYPVTESNVNETVVEDYDCGSDVNSSNCRRVSPANTNNGGSNGNSNGCSCGRSKGWSWI